MYNFPINIMAEIVKEQNDFPSLDVFREVLKWEDGVFTKSDMMLLAEVVRSNWCQDSNFSISSENLSIYQRFPLLLNSFSDKVLLVYGSQNPLVKFNDLLRWRCLSLNIGEDILICSFLAARDVNNRYDRSSYLWPLVLEHDNIRINSILEEELTDTHAHINASADIFEFNWLAVMNHPGSFFQNLRVNEDKERQFGNVLWQGGASKHYDTVARYSKLNHTLLEWSVVAAAIRVFLYAKVTGVDCSVTRELITEMFSTDIFNWQPLENVSAQIAILAMDALPASNDLILDYTIKSEDFTCDNIKSPLTVNHGERKFLYRWFHAYFANEPGIRADADLMLLYLIIKVKVRREFIQTNPLSGFVNFQDYNQVKNDFWPNRKSNEKNVDEEAVKTKNRYRAERNRFQIEKNRYQEELDKYKELAYRYAIQTSLGESGKVNLEMRLTAGELNKIRNWDYRFSIFGKEKYLDDSAISRVTAVVHFLKSSSERDSGGETVRHTRLRKQLTQDSKKILKYIQETGAEFCPKIVGVDAAGSELNCRPEVFAPYFRNLRNYNIPNFTFHAGEDFYDIVDGLRTIDEAVNFMDYKFGDRIGHGLALGLNVFEFYDERHNNMIIPAQILLDNLVWLKFFAAEHNINLSPKTHLFIEQQFRDLSLSLEFPSSVNITDYRHSMNMRGDMISICNANDSDVYPPEVNFSPISENGKNDIAKDLWMHYEKSGSCREMGNKVKVIVVPSSYANDIAAVQEAMLVELEKRGIVIECNPSSNVKIGRFSRYDEHPIYKLHSIDGAASGHTMMVSINTDDKGIFATSLTNEYSLIAIALSKVRGESGKRRWSDGDIENYLKRVVNYGNISRFRHVY